MEKGFMKIDILASGGVAAACGGYSYGTLILKLFGKDKGTRRVTAV